MGLWEVFLGKKITLLRSSRAKQWSVGRSTGLQGQDEVLLRSSRA